MQDGESPELVVTVWRTFSTTSWPGTLFRSAIKPTCMQQSKLLRSVRLSRLLVPSRRTELRGDAFEDAQSRLHEKGTRSQRAMQADKAARTPHASRSSRIVFRSAAWLMAGLLAASAGTLAPEGWPTAAGGAAIAEHRCTASEPLVDSPRRCPWNVGGACNSQVRALSAQNDD